MRRGLPRPSPFPSIGAETATELRPKTRTMRGPRRFPLSRLIHGEFPTETEASKPTWEFPPASSSLQFPANLLQAGIGTKVGFLIESFCLDTISGLFLALSSSNCFTTRFAASLQMVDKCLRMERNFRGSTFDPSSAKLVDASILCLDRWVLSRDSIRRN